MENICYTHTHTHTRGAVAVALSAVQCYLNPSWADTVHLQHKTFLFFLFHFPSVNLFQEVFMNKLNKQVNRGI